MLAAASASIAFNRHLVSSLGCVNTGFRRSRDRIFPELLFQDQPRVAGAQSKRDRLAISADEVRAVAREGHQSGIARILEKGLQP